MKIPRWLTVVVVLGLLLGSVASIGAAPGQQSEKVRLLIGFARQPGPAEEALVRGVGGAIKYTYHLIPAIAATVPEGAIAALQANADVAYVEPDAVVHALDELDNSWGVDRIDAEVVHDDTNKGTGVKVAVIDSGIDYTHPDLDDNYKDGYDFANNDADPMDDYGHGTHVAGIVAAEDNDIDDSVVGVAPEASLYSLKVLDSEGMGYTSDTIAAIEWSMGYGFDFDGDEHIDEQGVQVDVINMSIGWSGSSKSLEDACDAAYKTGVVLVAAAGNGGRTIPAAFDSVIAVAATDSDDKIPTWSSKGSYIELAAPGVAVFSTWNDSDSPRDPQPVCYDGVCYKYGSGTSMASPHVAGTVALMIAGGVADIRTTLQETADRLMRNENTGYPDNSQGYGLVDAGEAVLGTE